VSAQIELSAARHAVLPLDIVLPSVYRRFEVHVCYCSTQHADFFAVLVYKQRFAHFLVPPLLVFSDNKLSKMASFCQVFGVVLGIGI